MFHRSIEKILMFFQENFDGIRAVMQRVLSLRKSCERKEKLKRKSREKFSSDGNSNSVESHYSLMVSHHERN